MVFLPSKSIILDDEILTNEWKTYYGMIRDYIAQMVGGDKAESNTITEGKIAPSKAFMLVDSENELEVDDLEQISITNFVDGNWICLTMANKDHAIVLKNGGDGDGAIYTYTGADEKLEYGEVVVLRLDGTVWRQVDISGYMRASAEDLQTMTSTKKVATLAQLQPYIDNKSLAAVGLLAWAVRKPEGFVPCDNAQEYLASDFPAVKKMLDNGLLPNVTYDEYNSSVASTGLCEKFGYSADSGKFYVPYLKTQVIQGTTYYPYICLYNSVTAQSLIDQQAILDEGLTLYNQMKTEFEDFKAYVEQQMTAITTAVEGAVATINTTKDEAVSTVNQTSTSAVNTVNNAATTAVQQVEDAYADFNTLYNEKTQGLITTANNQIVNINNASEENINKSRIWATGEDAEVETLEAGEHSSRGYADLSMAIANTPEDTPIDASTLVALDVIRGPRGYTGEKGAGLPTGGTTGQAVIKKSNTDYDYEWANIQVDTSDCVKLTGAQTIAGEKIFTGDNASDTANLKIKNTTTKLGTTPTSEKSVQLRLEDSSGDWTGLVHGKIKTDGSNCIELCVRKPDKSGSGFLSLNSSLDGDISLTASDGVKNSIKDWIGGGGSLEIGDIGFSPFGVDETKNTRRYLNGQVISQTQFSAFTTKLKSWQSTRANLFTTEDDWQAEKTNSINNTCGKFVIDDSAGTIRLPKYPEYISKEYKKTAVIGDGTALGIMNSDGILSSPAIKSGDANYYGGWMPYGDGTITNVRDNTSTDVNGRGGVSTAADRSGLVAVFQNADTETLAGQYFIQVATSSEDDVDITNEIQLNNPFTLFESKYSADTIVNASWLISNGTYHSGATYVTAYQALAVENNAEVATGATVTLPNGSSYTKRGLSVKLSTDTYDDYDYVLNTTDSTFRLPVSSHDNGRVLVESYVNGAEWYNIYSDGWCEQGGYIPNQTRNDDYPITLMKSYKDVNYSLITDKHIVTSVTGSMGTISFYTKNKTASGFTTGVDGNVECYWRTSGYVDITSANIHLYFYIGETIQDANIINASGVLTRVANCLDRTVASDVATVTGWSMPDYSRMVNMGTTVGSGTNPGTAIYTAPSDGWFITQATGNYTNNYIGVLITLPTGQQFSRTNGGSTSNENSGFEFLVPAGTTIVGNRNVSQTVYFAPLKGVN